MKETFKQRAERKGLWLARATSHFSTPEILEEAIDTFDKANPIEECSDYDPCPKCDDEGKWDTYCDCPKGLSLKRKENE